MRYLFIVAPLGRLGNFNCQIFNFSSIYVKQEFDLLVVDKHGFDFNNQSVDSLFD
jgi:hypothetical protein